MIKAVIVDDEPYSCDTLSTLLERHCPEVEVTGIFQSGKAALEKIPYLQPQLLFLDIEMPHLNGFQLLEKLNEHNFKLIFTTSYDQYAIKAIRFSAIDYLLKPIDPNELREAVDKAILHTFQSLSQQLEILMHKLDYPATPVTRVAMPTMEGLQLIPVNDIISCFSESNYTTLNLKDNNKLVVSKTLKEIADMLEDHSFCRVHNTAVVNLNHVTRYIKGEGGYVIMSEGSTIDVSRGKKEMLLKKLQPPK
jgi:two-component system LytT family response regulator